jgi:hypothetical protein
MVSPLAVTWNTPMRSLWEKHWKGEGKYDVKGQNGKWARWQNGELTSLPSCRLAV